MSEAIVIIPDDGGPMIVFDGTESETHTTGSIVTAFPVEQGADVSDHIRVMPTEFRCVVNVTETPHMPNITKGRGVYGQKSVNYVPYEVPKGISLGTLFREIGAMIAEIFSGPKPQPPVRLDGVLVFLEPFLARQETLADLRAVVQSRTTCTVLTSIAVYDNMVITRAELPIDQTNKCSIPIDFKQLIVVTSKTVDAPVPKEPRGTPAKAGGAKAPEAKPLTPEEKEKIKQSVLWGLYEAWRGG